MHPAAAASTSVAPEDAVGEWELGVVEPCLVADLDLVEGGLPTLRRGCAVGVAVAAADAAASACGSAAVVTTSNGFF